MLLRREGLYSSHLSEWRKAHDGGALAGLSPTARPAKTSAERRELAKAVARAERAERELAKTKAALEIVGKAHALLAMLSESACDRAAVEAVINPAVLLLAEHSSTARACDLLASRVGATTAIVSRCRSCQPNERPGRRRRTR